MGEHGCKVILSTAVLGNLSLVKVRVPRVGLERAANELNSERLVEMTFTLAKSLIRLACRRVFKVLEQIREEPKKGANARHLDHKI